MKIIVPFVYSDYFRLEDESILSALALTPKDIIDEVLRDWQVYSMSEADVRFEHLMDQLIDHIHDPRRGPVFSAHAETVLAEKSDTIADLVNTLTCGLRFCLMDLPADVQMDARFDDADVFRFMCVKEIKEHENLIVVDIREVDI